MLAVLEWLGALIFIIFALIRLFTKNTDEQDSRPLPTGQRSQSPPPPPRPSQVPAQPYGSQPPPPPPREQAASPEQQIRNFLQDLQRRMAEQQQASVSPPPPVPRHGRRHPKREAEPIAVVEEVVEVPASAAESFPEEAPIQHSESAYTLEDAPVHSGLKLAFDRESIRKAFVLREILGSPRAENPF